MPFAPRTRADPICRQLTRVNEPQNRPRMDPQKLARLSGRCPPFGFLPPVFVFHAFVFHVVVVNIISPNHLTCNCAGAILLAPKEEVDAPAPAPAPPLFLWRFCPDRRAPGQPAPLFFGAIFASPPTPTPTTTPPSHPRTARPKEEVDRTPPTPHHLFCPERPAAGSRCNRRPQPQPLHSNPATATRRLEVQTV